MLTTKVLMVISAADRWTLKDGTVRPSGYWAEEVARPHQIFTEAGWEITVATPIIVSLFFYRIAAVIESITAIKSSCSQNRSTVHPADCRAAVCSISRFEFPSSFGLQ